MIAQAVIPSFRFEMPPLRAVFLDSSVNKRDAHAFPEKVLPEVEPETSLQHFTNPVRGCPGDGVLQLLKNEQSCIGQSIRRHVATPQSRIGTDLLRVPFGREWVAPPRPEDVDVARENSVQ